MNYDKDTRAGGVSGLTGEVLAEAMPWIKNVTGKTVVIKYGGAAMVDAQLRAEVMADIVLLKIIGVNPVIVHGGGKAITAAMNDAGLPVEFIDGQRVTSFEAMEVVRAVLAGKVNQELVEAMNVHGNLAVGVCGSDAGTIIAEQADARLGRVGRIVRINTALLSDLVRADYIPVVASVGIGEAAGEDFSNKGTLISKMMLPEAKRMVEKRSISSGMIPKLSSCVRALEAGVHRAHIINGTTPHALLLELLTDCGIGTMVKQPEEVGSFEAQPLGNFAAKLIENR